MRRFIVNKGTKLILSKNSNEPLNIDKLKCTRLFEYDQSNSGAITISYIQKERQPFKVVEVKAYDYNEEYVCYAFVTNQFNDGTETDMGLMVKIPRTKDRIIVETTPDFDPCDAVEIIEED